MDRTIYTTDGEPIAWLPKDANNFVDKTTMIYGGSNSGKSVYIDEILSLVKTYIPNFIVIAPLTSQKRYMERLPQDCVKPDLSKKKLQKIWNRQENVTEIYNIVNSLVVLEMLFKRVANSNVINRIKQLKSMATRVKNDIRNSTRFDHPAKKSYIERIDSDFNKYLRDTYKQSIEKNKVVLYRMDLKTEERVALDNWDINPRLMIVLDDCTEKFKTWMKYFSTEDNVFEKLFYRGRHNFISLVFACHADKILATELRASTRLMIFANSQSLMTYIEKKTNGFSKEQNNYAKKILQRIFDDEHKPIEMRQHKKLCFNRDESAFYYTIADVGENGNIASTPLLRLAREMPHSQRDLSQNPLIQRCIRRK